MIQEKDHHTVIYFVLFKKIYFLKSELMLTKHPLSSPFLTVLSCLNGYSVGRMCVCVERMVERGGGLPAGSGYLLPAEGREGFQCSSKLRRSNRRSRGSLGLLASLVSPRPSADGLRDKSSRFVFFNDIDLHMLFLCF